MRQYGGVVEVAGAIIFICGGTFTIAQAVPSCVAPRAMPALAAGAPVVGPAELQPWIGLVNTALLTLGTSLIVLRQRWIKTETDRQHGVSQMENAGIRDQLGRQRDLIMSENSELKGRILNLSAQIEVLREHSCTVTGCALRQRQRESAHGDTDRADSDPPTP